MAIESSSTARKITKTATRGLLIATVVMLLVGCNTVPMNPLRWGSAAPAVMKDVMAREDKVVLLSSSEFCRDKPVLLLLHGATYDPTEMMSIASASMTTHNVLLYSYNFHHSIKRIGAGLIGGMKALKSVTDNTNLTVITYSYSAIIFRKTILLPGAEALFDEASLIQLVPTAGGSRLARSLENPIALSLVSLASKASAAQSPYGANAEALWGADGNRRFGEIIRPERVHTLLLEMDSHSLAGVRNEKVQMRYRNGLGLQVVVIAKSRGATHDNFPNHPVVLAEVRNLMKGMVSERSTHVAGSTFSNAGAPGR